VRFERVVMVFPDGRGSTALDEGLFLDLTLPAGENSLVTGKRRRYLLMVLII
jgi:hypothetical protein